MLNNNISYEYNADGIRIKKVVNNITTLYTVFNGIIIEETVEGLNGYTIKYIYDDNNLLLGFIYNNKVLNHNIYMFLNNHHQLYRMTPQYSNNFLLALLLQCYL